MKPVSFTDKFRWLLLGVGLKTLAKLLQKRAKKEPLLKRALDEFEGIYKFESPPLKSAYYLIFERGKPRVEKKFFKEPHFTFTIYDLSSFNFRSRSENLLEVVIANKIGQSGNIYYLYQFGFIMSLLERSFKARKKRKEIGSEFRERSCKVSQSPDL